MLFRIQSRKSLSEVAKALEAAAQRHKFGVLAVHDLKQKMQEKGVEFDRDCLIYEVCNPQQAKKVLEANTEISTALPCRISLYREGDLVTLATLRPTALLDLFQMPALRSVAEEVEQTMRQMMEEAAA
ncbi:MAG: hypothetical protein DMG24_10540 [Acidobacteria bacterium]|nr:MAG: hypothetical protein DMG24_10540 [Acidobacteriota bacterium]